MPRVVPNWMPITTRQHHRVRSDSKTGMRGVRYNPDNVTYSAYVKRNGSNYHVGTYRTQHEASAAYRQELRRENPDLHRAPDRVERQPAQATVKVHNPDQS